MPQLIHLAKTVEKTGTSWSNFSLPHSLTSNGKLNSRENKRHQRFCRARMIHLIKLFPIATHSYSKREINNINDHSESNSVCKNAKLFCVCHNKQKSIENYENFFRFKLLLLLQNILAENIKITCSQEFMKCFFIRKLQEKKNLMTALCSVTYVP